MPDQKVKVLLVDDRPENLLVLKATLAPLGAELTEANSGKEALKYLLDQDFAAILLDVMMPEMDGFETASVDTGARKIKAHANYIHHRNVPWRRGCLQGLLCRCC